MNLMLGIYFLYGLNAQSIFDVMAGEMAPTIPTSAAMVIPELQSTVTVKSLSKRFNKTRSVSFPDKLKGNNFKPRLIISSFHCFKIKF